MGHCEGNTLRKSEERFSSSEICTSEAGLNLRVFPLLEGLSADEVRFFVHLANGDKLGIAAQKTRMSAEQAKKVLIDIKKRLGVKSLKKMRKCVFL